MFSTLRNARGRAQLKFFTLAFLALWLATVLAPAKDSLVWQKDKNTVAAEISSWSLSELLESIASATGWQIYVEPETKHTVSTKFKDRPPGEALRLLLGDLSFALLPEKNAPSRLYVFRTTMQGATQLVKAPDKEAAKKAKPIADELVVTVKPGTDIDALAKKLGAKIIGRADALNTYRLKFDNEDSANSARETLKSDSSVDNIDNNYSISRPDTPSPLNLSSIPPMSLTPKAVPDADRLIVGLIDTAIQRQGTSIEGFLLPSISVAGDAAPPTDSPTHGTSMWEIMLRGVTAGMNGEQSSSVRILPVDVYGKSENTTTFDVAVGVYRAINAGAMMINMSLGSYGGSTFLQQVIQSGASQGVVFFASAGNQPVTTPTYPAAYPEVIAVTAADRNGQLASYANRGSFVDTIGPGTGVVEFGGRAWMVMGTSAASAWTAGFGAGIANRTGQTPAKVGNAIRTSSVSRIR